jgi:hypothetical protein
MLSFLCLLFLALLLLLPADSRPAAFASLPAQSKKHQWQGLHMCAFICRKHKCEKLWWNPMASFYKGHLIP